jgi:hypothetical protein
MLKCNVVNVAYCYKSESDISITVSTLDIEPVMERWDHYWLEYLFAFQEGHFIAAFQELNSFDFECEILRTAKN